MRRLAFLLCLLVAAPAAAQEPPRDYFRVEDGDGRRYWLYRTDGRWYLHGLFA
jgi:protein ImuB